MEENRPSEGYQNAIIELTVEAMSKALREELDWNFADKILNSVGEYVRKCSQVGETQGDMPVSLTDYEGALVLSVDVFEEGDVAFSLGEFPLRSVCEAYVKSWGDRDEKEEAEVRGHLADKLIAFAAEFRAATPPKTA